MAALLRYTVKIVDGEHTDRVLGGSLTRSHEVLLANCTRVHFEPQWSYDVDEAVRHPKLSHHLTHDNVRHAEIHVWPSQRDAMSQICEAMLGFFREVEHLRYCSRFTKPSVKVPSSCLPLTRSIVQQRPKGAPGAV